MIGENQFVQTSYQTTLSPLSQTSMLLSAFALCRHFWSGESVEMVTVARAGGMKFHLRAAWGEGVEVWVMMARCLPHKVKARCLVRCKVPRLWAPRRQDDDRD